MVYRIDVKVALKLYCDMVTLKRFSKAVMLPQDGVYAPETMFF